MSSSSQSSPVGAVIFAAAVIALTIYVAAWLPAQQRQLPVGAAEQRRFDEQRELTNTRLQDMISERLADTQMSAERAREESQLGQELSLRCLQWTDLYDSQPSEEALKFQEHACRRYNHYVTTGELLEAMPDPEVELL